MCVDSGCGFTGSWVDWMASFLWNEILPPLPSLALHLPPHLTPCTPLLPPVPGVCHTCAARVTHAMSQFSSPVQQKIVLSFSGLFFCWVGELCQFRDIYGPTLEWMVRLWGWGQQGRGNWGGQPHRFCRDKSIRDKSMSIGVFIRDKSIVSAHCISQNHSFSFSQESTCISVYMQMTFWFSLISPSSLWQARLWFLGLLPHLLWISGTACEAGDLHCIRLCVCVLRQRFSIASAVTTKGAFNWFLAYPQWKMTSIGTGSCFLFQIPLLQSHAASAYPSAIQNQPTCHLTYRDHKFLIPVLDNLWMKTCKIVGVLNNYILKRHGFVMRKILFLGFLL